MRSNEFSGQRLAEVVAAQGRRWDWLAEQTGLHYTLLWQYRVGRRPITRKSGAKIAAALGISLDDLRPQPTPAERVTPELAEVS